MTTDQGPHLYIMCGLPFSGKTTLSKLLAERFGWVHLQTDAINTERGLGLDGAPISTRQWAETYREAHRRLDALLACHQTVVYDATNFRKIQRELLRKIARKHHVPTTVIYVTTPETEVERRRQQNRRSRYRNDVRDDDLALVVAQFQPPSDDEQVICYDQSLAAEQWVKHELARTTNDQGP